PAPPPAQTRRHELMEISERELRALASEVDEQHRAGMASMAADVADLHAATRAYRPDRRSLLTKSAAAGGALAIGGMVLPIAGLVQAASAQTTTTVAALT